MSGDRHPPAFPSVGGEPPREEADTIIFEPTHDPIASEPIAVAPVKSPASSRLRWAVAGVATLAVVALVAGFLLMSGPRAGTPSAVAQYAPAGVETYFEARLDLPGDQRQQLAQFMSRFPGFADQASFELKLDETFNSLLQRSGSGLDWARDIEPWFGGQIAFFGSSPSPAATDAVPGDMAVVVAVSDPAALETLLSERLAGVSLQDEDHHGTTVRSTSSEDRPSFSYAITDEALIASVAPANVKAALDVRGDRANGLADDAWFLQQLGALHADRLATFYVGGLSSPAAMPDSLPSMLPTGCMDAFANYSDIRLIGDARADGDRMSFTSRLRMPAGAGLPPLPANAASTLSAVMPPDAIAYFETRQLGVTVGWAIDKILDCVPEGGQFNPEQITQMIGAEPREYFDFVGDTAVALTYRDDKIGGGLIASVDDEAVARTRLERILTAVRAVGSMGGGLTVTEEEHAGATLTVIEMSQASPLPVAATDVALALTVHNGRLYIGLRDFVTEALDRTTDSLASNADFARSLAAGGTQNAGVTYVDLTALRAAFEAKLDPATSGSYTVEAQPFIEPFDHLTAVHRVDGDVLVTTVMLYVE